ncbi:MAG TPA: YXWGXW repeat-containing protein [Casimicrobiaceae bacterium]
MNARKTLLALCVAVGSGAALLPAVASAEIYVRIAPPAPRTEVVPVMRPGYVWVPGYWNWNGRHYVWVRGHTIRSRRGYHWTPDRWAQDHGRWHRERGRWDRD